jgi:hypothetical protein
MNKENMVYLHSPILVTERNEALTYGRARADLEKVMLSE